MADDDFDIDIYGDTNTEDTPFKRDEEGDVKIDGTENANGDITTTGANVHEAEVEVEAETVKTEEYTDNKTENNNHSHAQAQQIKSTDESGRDVLTIPKQAPQQQGVKRKEGSDDRPIDPGATSAILVSDLHWWTTDDDVRGWVNQAQCEDELKDVTFSEHKVNGKSKGSVT